MADRTSIEWTDATWNPIRARFETLDGDEPGAPRIGWHCEHVSEGCRRCYAEAINRRLGTLLPFKPGHRRDVDIFLDAKMLAQPLRWKRSRMIFVGSMTDLFADFVPDAMIDAVFAIMALTPHHTYQVLTKRPDRMRRYMQGRAGKLARFMIDEYLVKGGEGEPARGRAINVSWPVKSVGPIDDPEDVTMRHWPLPNVWLGTSVEDQAAFDRRVPQLRETPAHRRFLSCEPLLGPLSLRFTLMRVPPSGETPQYLDANGIDWVIVGGESGQGARPMHPAWVRDLRDQCAHADVPFLFKQWGAWTPLVDPSVVNASWSTPTSRPGCPNMAAWPDGSVRFGGDVDPAVGTGITMYLSTKKGAGRLLDGVQHDGMPA